MCINSIAKALQTKMESAEQTFNKVSAAMKYTLSESSDDGFTNQTSITNQSASLPERTNGSLQSDWTLASPNISSYIEPVEIHCEIGSVPKLTGSVLTTLCGKKQDA